MDQQKLGTVAFFTGCVMNSMLGAINRSSVRLLNAAGYDVIVPESQICCGALANHAGLRETAREMARKWRTLELSLLPTASACFPDYKVKTPQINRFGKISRKRGAAPWQNV